MDYTIQQKFISMNRSNTPLKAIGTVVHETSDPGATDENEYNYFNTGNRSASAHAFVDKDSITQTIPWNEQAWHAGPSANRSFIGIELCHFEDVASFNEIWKRAVWLFAYIHAYIIKQPKVTRDNLMSHEEVSNKWHETNHTDPVNYFASFGKTVDNFRSEVQASINAMLAVNNQAQTPTQVKTSDIDILQLQKNLNRLKIPDSLGNSLSEDGVQGPRTTQAIKKFQNICGITMDGIIGNIIKNAINSIVAKPFLSIGATGVAVRYLQYRLGIEIDGNFGPKTRSRVASFQSSNGLTADGIVGPMTWLKIIN